MSLLKTVLYVQVRPNRMSVRNVTAQKSVDRASATNFSHPRTLIGDFTVADAFLKTLVAEARSGFSLRTEILMHPLDRVEGGLSQVEERVFRELAMGAGASKAGVHVGATLSDPEVVAKLEAGSSPGG